MKKQYYTGKGRTKPDQAGQEKIRLAKPGLAGAERGREFPESENPRPHLPRRGRG